MAVVKEYGFLQAMFRTLIYCMCEHDWETKIDRVIEPTFQEITARLTTFPMSAMPRAAMVRQHTVIMVCKKCGKVYKHESPDDLR